MSAHLLFFFLKTAGTKSPFPPFFTVPQFPQSSFFPCLIPLASWWKAREGGFIPATLANFFTLPGPTALAFITALTRKEDC